MFDNLMSEAVLSGCLLGYDTSRDECRAKIYQASFAEGDDPDKNAGQKVSAGGISIEMRFDVPPQEAIDYFKHKKIVSADEFAKLSREAKAGAFSVSNLYNEDLTQAFYDEIAAALES